MDNNIIIMAIIAGAALIFILLVLIIRRNTKKSKLRKMLDDLDYQKNQIDTSPVGPELSKIENYNSNEKMRVLYEGWKDRLKDIKEIKIPKITDMLIEAEYSLNKKDYKSTMYKIAKVEMEIYKVKTASDFLLDEIKGITDSEERSRGSITKIKSRYRELLQKFNETKSEFKIKKKTVSMQFENISKRFEEFEILMEHNQYTEIPTVLKSADEMLNHMEVVLDELPSIVLIACGILPKKINEIMEIYNQMVKEGYPLDYLNVEFNVEEAKKKISDILDRAKVLNLEDSLFDLKVLTEYFENLFTDFEKEKVIRKDYEEAKRILEKKLYKTNKLINDIIDQIDDLKRMYKLSEENIEKLYGVQSSVMQLNDDYKILNDHTKNNSFAYSKLTGEVEGLANRLAQIDEDLDNTLNVIGNMHDDEVRARQQLDEVKTLLKKAQNQIRTYNLPVIPNSYYVELKEAKEAMNEIVKELDKKPITIETLNTRVDTARDLALKLYTRTKDMMKTAIMTETSIVYGNRYRSSYKELDKNLNYSESLFNRGEYSKALEITINALNQIEPGIYDRLLKLYGEKD